MMSQREEEAKFKRSTAADISKRERERQKEKSWNLSASSSADCARILINIPRPRVLTRPARHPLIQAEGNGALAALLTWRTDYGDRRLRQRSNLTPRWPRPDGESRSRLVLAKWKMDIISNMIGLWRKFINPVFILIGHITQGRDTALHL